MVIPASNLAGNRSNISELDQYSTPPYATHALMKREIFEGVIWECASGEGRMADVIRQYYSDVKISDILMGVNFLTAIEQVDNIITNPPYNLAEEFVKQGLAVATKKLALFLRLNFLESVRRYTLFKNTPLKKVYVFCKRQTLSACGVTKGGTIAYAWYVWEHGYTGNPTLDWIND